MAAPLCSQLFSPLPALFNFLSPSQFPGESPVRASLSFAERAHLSVFVRLVHAGSRRKHEEIARGGGEFRLLVEFNCLFRAPPSRHRDGRRSSPFFSSPRSSLYFPLLALCASANQQRASAPRDSRAQKGRRQEERRALRRKKKTMHRASFFFPQGFFFFPRSIAARRRRRAFDFPSRVSTLSIARATPVLAETLESNAYLRNSRS